MHYNSADDWLKPIECIQDKALIISVVVLSELATCSTVPLSLHGSSDAPTCLALPWEKAT
jgi:hypothetical protein